MSRKCILYIACSVDGFIAGPEDDLSFLDKMGKQDYGYEAFLKTVDSMIVGRKTYEWVKGKLGYFPTHDLETFVITRSLKGKEDNVVFSDETPTSLVKSLKQQEGENDSLTNAELVKVTFALNELQKEIKKENPTLFSLASTDFEFDE